VTVLSLSPSVHRRTKGQLGALGTCCAVSGGSLSHYFVPLLGVGCHFPLPRFSSLHLSENNNKFPLPSRNVLTSSEMNAFLRWDSAGSLLCTVSMIFKTR